VGELSAGTHARKPPGSSAPSTPSSLTSLALLLSPAFEPLNEVVGLTGARFAVELEVELAAGAATALSPLLALSEALGIG